MKSLTIIEQLNNNQFTFYDNHLGTILREFTGFEYAEVKESIDDVAGPYGSVYINSKHGKRSLSIQGDLVSDNIFDLRRQLLKAVRQTGVIKLIRFTTYDDLLLQFEAEVVKVLNPYTHQIHSFLIELIAPDWRFYSQTLLSYDVGVTIIRGGTSIPLIIPAGFPSPSADETEVNNIVNNIGNEVTDPVLALHGPGDGFTIGNDTTGKSFFLDYTLSDTDEVEIDVKNRTVILNDITNIYSSIVGDFWSIPPGENELRFLVNSGLTPDTNLNVAFRSAYIGI